MRWAARTWESRSLSSIPAQPSSAACSRRRSTTYVLVGVDSGLRRNDGAGGALKPRIANRFRLVLSSSALKIKRLLPAPTETGVLLIAVNQYVTDL